MTEPELAHCLVIAADHGRPSDALAATMAHSEVIAAIGGDCVSAFRLRAARLRMVDRLRAMKWLEEKIRWRAMSATARDVAADCRNAARFALAAHARTVRP